jgi:hypothetical protein
VHPSCQTLGPMSGLLPAAKSNAAIQPRHFMVSARAAGLLVAEVSTVVQANRRHSRLASGSMNACTPRHRLSVRWRPAHPRRYAKRMISSALATRRNAKGCSPQRGPSVLRRPAHGIPLPRLACGRRASGSRLALRPARCDGSPSSANLRAVAYFALMKVPVRSSQVRCDHEQAKSQYKYNGQSVWPNTSVEATSNGWPHRASCSFLALCGQPSAAPHLER